MAALPDIETQTFEGLLRIQCTQAEVMAVLGVSKAILQRWVKVTYGRTFTQVAEEFRAFGKVSLRRAGFRLAEKNPAVWIFMAKNYLGMSDEPKAQDTGEDKKELESAIKSGLKALKESGKIAELASFPPPPGERATEVSASASDDDYGRNPPLKNSRGEEIRVTVE